MSYQSFEDLEVWRRTRALVHEVDGYTERIRDWSLRDQMRRAAVSVASNIAEGAERSANTEFVQFIGIGKSSAAELRTQLYLTMNLGLIANAEVSRMVNETKLLGAKLEALRRSLRGVCPPQPNT